MADDDTPDHDEHRGPLKGLPPHTRLAIAGVGVVVGVALIFLGLREFDAKPEQTPVVNVPEDVGTLPPTSGQGAN